MYILRESRQNEADGQKVSGQYHLIGDAFHVALKYYDLDTENPQGRITINGLETWNPDPMMTLKHSLGGSLTLRSRSVKRRNTLF